jgi:hypothetical protein
LRKLEANAGFFVLCGLAIVGDEAVFEAEAGL